MSDDFYDLLDVPEDASQEDIKEAFREQVRIYHPDLNDDDRAQAQFTTLKKAYDILGDPSERKAYDRLGHEKYVAKRTSGIPSPDLWQSDDDSSSEPTTSSSAGGSSRSTTTTGSTTSTSSTTTGTASSSNSTSTSTSASTSTSNTTTTSGSTSTRTSSSTDGSTSTPSQPGGDAHTGGFTDNAVVRWWKRQNFGWPLVWTVALTYLIGLVHFAVENADGLRELWTQLIAAGVDPNGLWATISSSTHGIDTLSAFIVGVELVEPPLAPMQWYGLLAGVVAFSLGIVAGNRVLRRHETLGSVTIDELMVISLAIAIATVLVGGPLLVGIVLLPILFGVIVRRTRQLPGWKPSYAYVLAVCTPAVALAAGWAGYGSLPEDLLAFVVGFVGAIGFPLRALIRTRFGR
ncbi:J domain-containing protein [Natrialbaceae archaeon A-gly3]